MRNNREYQICKDIAIYMRYQYPGVLYRFDLAGLNLSKAQAGMNKAIQCGKGWPDLFITEPRSGWHGLFVELKKEGETIFNKKGFLATPHIAEQFLIIERLRSKGYVADFAVGFDKAKEQIDNYMKL